ncbi:MAG: PLP-dependent transferase [Thermoplasmata archaeon]
MKRGFNTRAVQEGEFRDRRVGNVTTPIFETSTFFNPNPEPQAYIDHTRNEPFMYTRWGNPTLQSLEAKYASLDSVDSALSFSSGMGAITTVMLSFLRKGDRILAIRELYGETFLFFSRFLPTMGVEVDFVGLDKLNSGEIDIRGYAAVYAESIVNPTLGVSDIRLLGRMCQEEGVPLVIDATFASPYNQNPFLMGADFVLHSGTKYIGGHSDIVLGLAGFGRESMKEVWTRRRMLGTSPDPLQAYLGLRGLKTLGLRMEAHNRNALAVARFLEGNSKVKRVYYPGLESSPYNPIAKRNMKAFGGVVSFVPKGDLETARRIARNVKVFSYAPSLGGVESLLTIPLETAHSNLKPEERKSAGIEDSLIRLSVGIEDEEDLIGDLEEALERA